jgi:hypothetical protein
LDVPRLLARRIVDVADLRSLVLRTEHIMWEALVLLFGVFAGTFGGVVSAAAVMAISPNEDNPDRDASSNVADYMSKMRPD